MVAYVIADVEVHDEELWKEYRAINAKAMQVYGGKVLGRGKADVLDGEWNTKNVVVSEFPSVENARAWFNSKEYAPALAIRRKAATARVMIIPGL